MLGVGVISVHKPSQSIPGKISLDEDNLDHLCKADNGHLEGCTSSNEKSSSSPHVQNTLRQEILQLEKRLQDQVAVRGVLEKTLGGMPVSHDSKNEIPLPKPTTELIKDISELELEVMHLEQYLLSLYRKAFDPHQIPTISPSTKVETVKSPVTSTNENFLQRSVADSTSGRKACNTQADRQFVNPPINVCEEEGLVDPGVLRCQSSLSQYSTTSLAAGPLGRGVHACYSQPSSMVKYAQNNANLISLAEYLGTPIADHMPETPNKLSEDMIKCVCDIYYKLSDPPLANHRLSSPTSSLSSTSAFSPSDHSEMWSPGLRKYLSSDERLDNPFHIQGPKEFSGPYSTMVEVQHICRDTKKLIDVEHLLQKYRSLISQLVEIDPRKMNHEEKLSFWINVHNAMVMHAYLTYGIPQNNVKRLLLLQKAAYNIGNQIISADLIQSTILGCRMSRPGQWLPRLLLSSRSKLKAGDKRQAYSIEHQQPLLHFALCAGSHSDPPIRVYTSKRVLEELETAKEEYLRATIGIRKDHKVLLPKLVESFAKDSSLCSASVMDMIHKSLPESARKNLKKCQTSKSRKLIEWIPCNFNFRYLISKSW
ncbi:hypothetical protein DCAR_0729490 [Daucus carota subsp. sativus]|uniref:DUF547 domain-containing protein n=1 Tax=Daucus carota subsp. sativus TaxID=79200 RepID=A0AAF0XNI4_DAUCS|nr:hypothetical protein DCAR_0729490 [Daucus carota subsp. sativus]